MYPHSLSNFQNFSMMSWKTKIKKRIYLKSSATITTSASPSSTSSQLFTQLTIHPSEEFSSSLMHLPRLLLFSSSSIIVSRAACQWMGRTLNGSPSAGEWTGLCSCLQPLVLCHHLPDDQDLWGVSEEESVTIGLQVSWVKTKVPLSILALISWNLWSTLAPQSPIIETWSWNSTTDIVWPPVMYSLWRHHTSISQKTKLCIYNTLTLWILCYGAETWPLLKILARSRLMALIAEPWKPLRILDGTITVFNKELQVYLHQLASSYLSQALIQTGRLCPAWSSCQGYPLIWYSSCGQVPHQMAGHGCEDLQRLNITLEGAAELAQDHQGWRPLMNLACFIHNNISGTTNLGWSPSLSSKCTKYVL